VKQRLEYVFDVEREALWRYVADTDWINRHSGLPPIGARIEAQRDGSTKRYARFWSGPFTNEWEELPTLWRAPEFYEIERRYTRGVPRRFVNRTSLESLGPSRTKVVSEIEVEPRNFLMGLVLPLVMMQGKIGADRAFALAAKLAVRGSGDDRIRGSNAFAGLAAGGISQPAIAALDRLLAESDEGQLATIRPYEVADRYGIPRREMLRACLAATRAGLFNLRWDVICPSCRGNSNSFDSLAEMRGDLHCANCNVPYGPQFDRSVEVTFNARPMGRGIDVPLFCIASPHRSSHVLAQTPLPAHGRETLRVTLEPGTYDINAVGIALTPFIAGGDDRSPAQATVADARVDFPHEIAAGEATVAVSNTLDRPAIVRIENGRWPDTIATAASVTALQEFRDMFSSEVLAPGLELGVESMAILFTDLLGSTAMYSKAGDAPAFRIVTDHFTRLRPIIEAGEGAIVKTIGDAVMAVFSSPGRCLAAALQMDDAVRDLEHDGVPLRLRVGFAIGPCIAMRANEKIDYFGTTVNLAARLEAKAGAGEVTMTRNAAERDDVREILRASGRDTTVERLPVKGFAADVEVVRVLAPK
jgi:class 3 adenylate cyclase